jgi:hypothetical protein
MSEKRKRFHLIVLNGNSFTKNRLHDGKMDVESLA